MKKTVSIFVPLVFLIFSSSRSEVSEVAKAAKIPRWVKQIEVFGIHVYAADNIADKKMLYATNVLAEYLDNDEDGVPANQHVVGVLVNNKSSLIMGKDQAEMQALDWSLFPPGETQELWDKETHRAK
jgi:hypothetical protein